MHAAVVILNWNGEKFLRKFLAPLLAHIDTGCELIVADNASTDGSTAYMRAEYPDLRIISLPENYGFAEGYNKALEKIEADYYVLLNSDLSAPAGWLRPMLEYMDSHPECAACGPKILQYEDHGSFEYAGAAGGGLDRYAYPFCRGRVPGRCEKDNGQYDGKPYRVLWVSGAALMIRSSVWKALGGLDGRFFAHMEEIDLCWRATLEGYSCVCVPESEVYHIGGGSLPNDSPRKLYLNYRNSLLMLHKNLPATLGTRKASRRLRIRKLMDLGSALVYLLQGQKEKAKAVRDAYRDAARIEKDQPVSITEAKGGTRSELLYTKSIVLEGIFHKKTIFARINGYFRGL